jgi:hypothetical protein
MRRLIARLDADSQEASDWQLEAAAWGDPRFLAARRDALDAAGDHRGAEVAAWMAAAESRETPDAVRDLADRLLSGAYGPPPENLVMRLAANALVDDAALPYDADLHVTLALLEHNAAAPDERDPAALRKYLTVARDAAARRMDQPDADDATRARLRDLVAEIDALIRALPGAARRLLHNANPWGKWPSLRRGGWASRDGAS